MTFLFGRDNRTFCHGFNTFPDDIDSLGRKLVRSAAMGGTATKNRCLDDICEDSVIIIVIIIIMLGSCYRFLLLWTSKQTNKESYSLFHKLLKQTLPLQVVYKPGLNEISIKITKLKKVK